MKISKSKNIGEDDEWYGYIIQCDKCQTRNIWDDFNYCPICGEKIEWVD
mgnify:CR=1 FL=1